MMSDDAVVCPHCGEDVTGFVHVYPALCKKVNRWCAFPCMRSADEFNPGFTCPYITRMTTGEAVP